VYVSCKYGEIPTRSLKDIVLTNFIVHRLMDRRLENIIPSTGNRRQRHKKYQLSINCRQGL